MNRLYVPTLGPTDWRRLLAKPETQWKRYRSALEMAVNWEAARTSSRGLPPEIAAAVDSIPELAGAQLLLGFPEHKVDIEGGGHPSQNDLWALLKNGDGFASVAIEAKAGEPLGDIVNDWLGDKSSEKSNKPERLAALQGRLGLSGIDVSCIRYQLLHRTASALIEAERFNANYAVMIVQSFNQEADASSWKAFVTFAEAMGANPIDGKLVQSTRQTRVPLFIGWITSIPADLKILGDAI